MSADGDAPSKDAPSKDAPSTAAPSKDALTKAAPSKPTDLLFVHSPTERGDGFKVVRMREDSVEVG